MQTFERAMLLSCVDCEVVVFVLAEKACDDCCDGTCTALYSTDTQKQKKKQDLQRCNEFSIFLFWLFSF